MNGDVLDKPGEAKVLMESRRKASNRVGSHSQGLAAIWRHHWILIYVLLVTGFVSLAFSHWAYDDPFITYRYAYNLSHGLGFVYNPGLRVLSTTTPLFTILLALLGSFWPDLPRLAVLIGALSVAVGGLFLWDLARTWKSEVVGWVSLFLYPSSALLLRTLGSETPLYLALCLGAFAGYVRCNYRLAALFAALAFLTRPDGALVAVLLAADYLFRVRRRIPWTAVILFLGMTLPWVVFSVVYFGSPLPATLAAKQHQGSMAISQSFTAGFLSLGKSYGASWGFRLETLLGVVGILFAIWRARTWLLFLSWTVLYFMAYSTLGVSCYHWYYAPLLPGFVVAMGLGGTAISKKGAPLARPFISKFGRVRAPYDISPSVLALFFIVPLTLAQWQNALQLRQSADQSYLIYRTVGEWLHQHTPPNAVVGMLEVGIIGYYSQRPIVDFAGLIQPNVAAQLSPQTTYDDSALWAVERYQPDYLVLHDKKFPRLKRNYVAKYCVPVQRFTGALYSYGHDIVIYSCR